MAEPPAKRSRRGDDRETWSRDDRPARGGDRGPKDRGGRRYDSDRRYRSRSKDRLDNRRERSWSRDRERPKKTISDRHRDWDRERDEEKDRRPSSRERDGRGGKRARHRSFSRDRYRGRRDGHERSPPHATRSRSPVRQRHQSRSLTPPRRSKKKMKQSTISSIESPVINDQRRSDDDDNMNMANPTEEGEGDEMEDEMKAMMGFGGFGTTKQKKIQGNDIYLVRKEKKTEYRQYMNRIGGFNRPLSPS